MEARNARLEEAIDAADLASQVPVSAPKLTDLYRVPEVLTWEKSLKAAHGGVSGGGGAQCEA